MAESTHRDRITQLRVSGLRVLEDLSLDLWNERGGLTVLIGDNGTGKSSILEALELLRRAADPVSFVCDVLVDHGGFQSLLRRGSKELRLGATIDGSGPRLDYDFVIKDVGASPVVVSEKVVVHHDQHEIEPLFENTLASQNLAAPWLRQPSFRRIIDALELIETHMLSRPTGIGYLDRFECLERNILYLRNAGGECWERLLERARLGLGRNFCGFRLSSSWCGDVNLEVAFENTSLPVDSLSEGQVSYLTLVALIEISTRRKVLALDGPEMHLHPALLSRVVWMLEETAGTCPIVISTHSDRLLDALSNPAQSIVLCELDERGATRLRRPDSERLADWMEEYAGFGGIRAEGYGPLMFKEKC